MQNVGQNNWRGKVQETERPEDWKSPLIMAGIVLNRWQFAKS